MTDLSTSTFTYTTDFCHYCGEPKSQANPLYHDGRSFIICQDAIACRSRVDRLELAEYFKLQDMAKCLRDRLRAVLKQQGALEKKLGLYDVAVEENRAALAGIDSDCEAEKS
jgi:hypothetical protein